MISIKSIALATVVLFCAVTIPTTVVSLDNGLALTPQMGWNSWNYFRCNVSDELIREIAQSIVDTGLSKLGYEYVNIDDCWQTSRDESGVIQPDPERFPYGMKPLVDFVHSLGLKFGLYSDAGEFTCQHRPGSLGYEVLDANTYAAWGVDYLKYDNCYNDNIIPEKRYPQMSEALNATGRPILFSMCEWGVDAPYNWAPQIGNSWRTTDDISDIWWDMLLNIDNNTFGEAVAGPGQWNDPDMLEVGNGGMTTLEYISHMSLWAIVKAPLIIGCDTRSMSNDTAMILMNPEVIRVNQDPLGIQGTKVFDSMGVNIWAGRLTDDMYAVVLINRNDLWNATFGFTFQEIGAPVNATMIVRCLWGHVNVGVYTAAFPPITLAPHESRMFRVFPDESIKHSHTTTHHHDHTKPRVILTEP